MKILTIASPKLFRYRRSFLISVILHLLLVVSTTIIITFNPENNQKPAQYYTPAYVYHGAITPVMQSQRSQQIKSSQSQSELDSDNKPAEKTVPPKQKMHLSKSVLAMSQEVLKTDQMNKALSNLKNQEPILLIGDANATVDPLIKLLGRSLSAHFNYPKIEGNLGMRGRVLVEMVLHPEGYYTDVQIVHSSNNQDFDAAALYAVNTAPKVVGADRFISQPKYFIVGFIFN
jgi:TonB family protein